MKYIHRNDLPDPHVTGTHRFGNPIDFNDKTLSKENDNAD